MADTTSEKIEALLQEQRRYPPPADFTAQANANDPEIYQRADEDPEGGRRYRAPALDKGLEILELLAREASPMPRNEIHTRK